ncbi:hypothetical protein Droror1_Dr00025266, partial [Drosera rotundifolia]
MDAVDDSDSSISGLQGVVFQLDENPTSPQLSRVALQAPSSSTSPLSRCSPSPAIMVEICCELMLQPQAAEYKVEICCEFVARILVYLYRTCLLPILCICIEHVSVQGGDMFAPASSHNSLFFFFFFFFATNYKIIMIAYSIPLLSY